METSDGLSDKFLQKLGEGLGWSQKDIDAPENQGYLHQAGLSCLKSTDGDEEKAIDLALRKLTLGGNFESLDQLVQKDESLIFKL